MKNQIESFVRYSKSGAIPKIDAANTMFFFAGGLNDGRRPDGFVRTNIESEIDALYDLGARRFMVAILPTKIPQFAAAGRRVNPELEKIPGEERAKHPDMRIANSQWGSFFDEVITNPAKFGLTDTATPCSDRPFGTQKITTCTNPDAYFFYHEGTRPLPLTARSGSYSIARLLPKLRRRSASTLLARPGSLKTEQPDEGLLKCPGASVFEERPSDEAQQKRCPEVGIGGTAALDQLL
jgi:hypothetical protein